MVSELRATQSASFLVSHAKITSAQPFPRLANHHQQPPHNLPKPNWSLIDKCLPTEHFYQSKTQLTQRIKGLIDELALAKQVNEYREETEQANTAMLVIQDMTLQKMNATLYAKENTKKKHNQIFAGGKGWHLTHPESIAAIQTDQDTHAEAKKQKVQRQSDRDRRKVDRAKIELQWRAIKELNTEKVQEWEVECTRLAAEGTLMKNLPKTPVCPLKPKLPKGPQAQSTNAGAPEGEEQSDSSSSSEEDDDEWSACEAHVTVCHTVSRSWDPGISAHLFNLLLLFPLQLVFAQKKISNSSNIQYFLSSDSIWGNQRSCGNYTGIGFWCLKVP